MAKIEVNPKEKCIETYLYRDALPSLPQELLDGMGEETASLTCRLHASLAMKGGRMSNTPPANRQNLLLSPVMEDTAHLSLWLKFKDFASLTERLESAKQAAKSVRNAEGQNNDNDTDSQNALFASQVILAKYVWNVQPRSICKQRLNFPYVLKAGGVVLMLNTGDCGETMPNAWLEIGSIPLTYAKSLPAFWCEWCDDLAEIATIKRHVLSRVDLCVDILNYGVDKFAKKYQRKKYITHACSNSEHYEGEHHSGQRPTGITIGKVIRMNIYDKLFEVRSDDLKRNVMMNEKWLPANAGSPPEQVTRLEFQTKRGGLRDYLIDNLRIDTVEDWQRQRVAVWNYLMTSFCRFTQGKIDRENNNQHRAQTWTIWDEIRERGIASLQSTGAGAVAEVRREERKGEIDLPSLNAQGVACLVKSYIFAGKDPADLSALFGWCAEVALRLQEEGKLPAMIARYLLERNERIQQERRPGMPSM